MEHCSAIKKKEKKNKISPFVTTQMYLQSTTLNELRQRKTNTV